MLYAWQACLARGSWCARERQIMQAARDEGGHDTFYGLLVRALGGSHERRLLARMNVCPQRRGGMCAD